MRSRTHHESNTAEAGHSGTRQALANYSREERAALCAADQPRGIANLPLLLARASGHDDNDQPDRDHDDSDPFNRFHERLDDREQRNLHKSPEMFLPLARVKITRWREFYTSASGCPAIRTARCSLSTDLIANRIKFTCCVPRGTGMPETAFSARPHTLLCRGDMGRPLAWRTLGPSKIAPRIGFARFWRIAPPKAFSGSMRDRKSRAHARFSRDSPKRPKTEGLDGGRRSLGRTALRGNWLISVHVEFPKT